jgi:hypothetical protein
VTDLRAVVGGDVAFVTARAPGSPFAALDRRVVVTGPPVLAELAASRDPAVVAGLVELLGDPQRAWAATVALSALTGREADVVEAFAGRPKAWWDAAGTGAHARWSRWLAEAGGRLEWDEAAGVLVAGDG